MDLTLTELLDQMLSQSDILVQVEASGKCTCVTMQPGSNPGLCIFVWRLIFLSNSKHTGCTRATGG